MSKRMISRREFLRLSAIVTAGAVSAACAPGATPTPAPVEEATPTPAAPVEAIKAEEATPTPVPVEVSKYNEAPMLAELVKQGKLPPVDERLPEDIDVVPVQESIGQYGGTWHAVTWDPQLPNIKMWLYDPPIRWKPDYTGYGPGLAYKYEWSEDGKTVTLYFRKGVKWSDGEPFTMEDLKFWWEDLATNEDYKVIQVPWWGWKSTGEPMDVEFPDDYTMVMKWDTPQWITPYILAQGFWEWQPLMKPKHYLKQFHPKYNPDSDYDTLEQIDRWWENPDYPVLFAWRTVEYIPGERAILERNPYYWKVDPEGNQLPYIDRLDIAIVPEKEVRVLQISQGKYDCTFRGTDDPRDIPFLAEQAESGGYHLQQGWMNGAGGWPCWLINQDYVEDEEIREVLRDKRFRKAISVALNRQRLVDVVWDGIGTPQQATISPQSWHFASPEGQQVFKEWQQADAEYDPEKAKAWLDEMGMVDQDGDGWRELPSGKKFELIIDVGTWGGEQIPVEGSQVLKEDLEAVGIKCILNNLQGQPEWDLRQREGRYMLRAAHASEVDIWTYPDWIFPTRDNRAWPMVGKWNQTGGKEGWPPEPGSPADRLLKLYKKGLAEPDIEERHKIVWEAIRIHIEEGPFTLGAAGDQPMPVVVKNNFHNVSNYGILGPWAPGSPGNQHPEQYWIEQ
ncbi:MAG TPA: hypothetical protein G4O02_12830 [Caldilineae bacterium]|nr:hypothetical protein [Caldilineae bacterium]